MFCKYQRINVISLSHHINARHLTELGGSRFVPEKSEAFES